MRTTISHFFTPKDAGLHRHDYGKLVHTAAKPFAIKQRVNRSLLLAMMQHTTRNTQHTPDRGATGFGVGGMAVARCRHAASVVGL